MKPPKAVPAAQLGDALRAFARLRPTDHWAGAAMLLALGVRRASVAAALPTGPDPAEPPPEGDEAPAPARARPQPRRVPTEGPAPPVRPATLEPLSQAQEAAPGWLQETEPLAVPTRAANPYVAEREPLFEPKLQRSLITRLAATWQPSGELDLAAVIRTISAGAPIRSVPRRSLVTTRKGVRLLVDQAESMQPFLPDVAQLARAFRRTVGAARLRVEGFVGVPSRDVQLGLDWHRYRPDSLGGAVVVLSDLGLPPQPLTAARVALQEWSAFFALERRAGHSPVVVVPREATGLPAALRQQARLVPWGRRAGVRSITAPGQGTPHIGNDARTATLPAEAGPSPTPLNPLASLDDDALRLATACALAVRVEPPLLRALRMRLLPGSSAELEARLWFSAVVTDRAATGLVLDGTAHELLRRRLRHDPDLLAQTWQVLVQAHAEAAPALRAEEEACYHWLRGDEEEARTVLRRMIATVVDPSRDSAWRWASQAVPRLPRSLMTLAEAQMLAVGTALRSGEGRLLEGFGRGGGAWHWLQPATRTLELAVTLREGVIEFAPATARSDMVLRVPDQPAVLIEILPQPPSGSAETVRLNPRLRTLVPIDGQAFELQVLGGERYRLQEQVQAAAAGAQKFVARNRAPRVQITYDLELYGAEKKIALPFVMGVMADLSGHPIEPLPPLEDRRFLNVDLDNFDACMGQIQPRVALRVPDLLSGQGDLHVDLTFMRMDDFGPVEVLRQVDPLARRLEQRQHLGRLRLALEGQESTQAEIAALLGDATRLRRAAAGEVGLAATSGEWLKAGTEAPAQDLQVGLQALAALTQELLRFQGGDVLAHVDAGMAALDRQLSEQLSLILHHQHFQNLERAWRGLHHLVSNSETDEMLKIRVLNLSKQELERSLRRAGAQWTQGTLYKKIHDEEYGQFGGEPYACLIGDYAFDHSPADVRTLTEMGRIAAAAHAPFIAAASPTLFQLVDWQELQHPRDLNQVQSTPEYAAWHALRGSDIARYLALAMPRFLGRLPYGQDTNAIADFDFEEAVGAQGGQGWVWINSAYAMAANINRAFKEYGWVSQIRGMESGGAVSGLPVFPIPTDDGRMGSGGPTEVAVSDRREAELSKLGLMPFIQRRSSDVAVFFSGDSLQMPREFDDPLAAMNARLASRLPFVFATSRFVHYLKCIVRDQVGGFPSLDAMEHGLNDWLQQYVDGDPQTSSESIRAMRPLAAARVVLTMPEPFEGFFDAQVYLQPHYQLEGLTTAIRLDTQLPGEASPA